MKNTFKTYGPKAALVSLAAVLAVVINPVFALLALVSVNPFTLCSNMVNANAATVNTYVSTQGNAKAKEEAWLEGVIYTAFSRSTWADNMMGGMGSGKPIEDYTDSKNIRGTTIHITTGSQLGGPGIQGDADRLGNEENLKQNSFDLVTGSMFFPLAQTVQAGEETIPGSDLDMKAASLLTNRVKVEVDNNIEMTYVGAGSTSRNQQFPSGRSYDTLMTADTITLSLITRGATRLSSLNGTPVKVRRAEAGYDIEKFMFVGTHENLTPLNADSNYLLALQYAQPRDATNPLFKGDFADVAGQIIYRQYTRKSDRYGSIGSALQPDAFLGTAIPADNTFGAGIITGGGSSTAATVTPLRNYFEFFRLFTYKKINGETVTTGSTTAYAAIIDNANGTVTPFSYTGNTGNTLTGCIRLSNTAAGNEALTLASGIGSGGMTASTGNYNAVTNPWTTSTAGNKGPLKAAATAIPSGSLIVQTNKAGVAVGYTLAVGGGGMCWGWGKGPAGKLDGERTFDQLQLHRDNVWGLRIRGGCTTTKDTNGTATGIVLLTHARQVDGMPDIAYA